MKNYFSILLICFLFTITLISQTYWHQTNGPYGGYIYSFTKDLQNNLYAVCGGELYKFVNYQWINYIPNSPNLRCALLKNNQLFFIGTNDGVYRSTNAGVNWTKLGNGLPDWQFNMLNVDSLGNIYANGSGEIFRSTNNGDNWVDLTSNIDVLTMLISHDNSLYIGISQDGLYKSTNIGNNWSKIAFGDTSVYSLADNSEYLYAAMDGNIFRSSDDGYNWQNLLNGLLVQNMSLFVNSNGFIYCGASGAGIYLSKNQGTNWIQTNQGLFNLGITSFGSIPNLIFAGANGGDGIYSSSNNGKQWVVNNFGLKASWVPSLAINRSGKIFAFVYQKGLYTSTDKGNNWILTTLIDSSMYYDEEDFSHRIAIGNNGDIFSTTLGINLSTDNGNTWTKINKQPIGYSLGIFIAPNNYIYTASSGRIYRSTNYGSNFTELNGIANNITCFNIDQIGNIIVGTINNNGIYYSTDNGNSFHHSDLSTPWVFCINTDKYNNLYAGVYGSGIMKSTNHGANWTFFGAVDEAREILFNQEGKIFVISYAGLQFSSDNGSHWSLLNTGMEKQYACSMALDSNGYVYIGTFDAGVYRSFESTISVKPISKSIPKSFSLYQNYPNPFNPNSKIKFDVGPPLTPHLGKEGTGVVLKIYDILGREVATLVNEKLQPGTYEVEFDGTNYPSGVYFYKLITESFSETKKLILLK